ncbi:hypothetical protein PoB_006204400 [Plakobranchus ocellatus]|uniref:Uncharacterized protein n=1 Tax=Plakobranchus ocellatus TaxID=259542 RepID=A0AAV4CUE9_9GAST|nr:hypothetical protein PoB_006204400 [Plakobranchus ocellatus]
MNCKVTPDKRAATKSKVKSDQGQQSAAATSHDGVADANVEMTNGSPVEDCFIGRETYHYHLTIKLFSLDRSCRNKIESVMEKFIKDDKAEHRISPEEKKRTLEAVQQYMKSAILYERQIAQTTQEPLTPEEKKTLNAMTKDEWRKLDAAQDEATKYQLQSHARQHVREKLFQCNTEDSHNRNMEMPRDFMIYRNDELKESSDLQDSPKVDDACFKARERSKVLTCFNAKCEGEDGHERKSNGLAALCAVALRDHPDQKENGPTPMEENEKIAVESEDLQMAVDVKKEL